jgi:RecA-family ATPase
VKQGRVLVYSCEEPERELKVRLKRILAAFNLTPAALGDRLIIANGYGRSDNILFTGQRDPKERLTGQYWTLLEWCKAQRPDLVIVDNMSEVYDGNEIDRAMVRQFIQSMNAICKWTQGALVLVGHVDAATSMGRHGKGYSGSTAWHNSVRSRLFMRPGIEAGTQVIECAKSNYGPQQNDLVIRFSSETKTFELLREEPKEKAVATDAAAQAVAKALADCDRKGVNVASTSAGPNNGVGVLMMLTGLKRQEVRDALTRMTIERTLQIDSYQKTDRHVGTRFALSPSGWASLVIEEALEDGQRVETVEVREDQRVETAKGPKGQRAKGPKGQSPGKNPSENVSENPELWFLE